MNNYLEIYQVVTPLGTAIVSLSTQQQNSDTQTINLNQGWTGISSYLQPESPQISVLLSAIQEHLVILSDLNGNYYQPLGDNAIIEWESTSGYFIKMENAGELLIEGLFIPNQTINIYPGWNLIPVLSETTVLVENVLGSNIGKIEILKDAVGSEIFWPDFNIETLNELLPGNSYLIKANEGFEITF